MANKKYDIIIIGAGPAGSSAAYRAARAGLNTLIIEKDNFPRYKPCGGAISKLSMQYLNFPIPKDLIQKKIFGARIHYGNNVVEKHKKDLLAVLVKRDEFDYFLLNKSKKAGAEVRQNEKVIDFYCSKKEVTVKTNITHYRTKFLIIAEGCHGRLKNKIRKQDKKNEYGICLVTEVPEKSTNINKYIKKAIDIHFGVAQLGYGWIFPLKNHYSVGIGGIAANLTDPTSVMNKFVKDNKLEKQIKNNKLKYKAHKIPAGGIYRETVGNRTVLVGDSAGFVDSFTGEGIAYAIRSGQLAAEVIEQIIKENSFIVNLSQYERLTMKEFGYDLKYSLLVSKIMHRIPSLFFRIFTSSDGIIDKYLDVAALKITYKEFFMWLAPRVPLYLLKTLIPNQSNEKDH